MNHELKFPYHMNVTYVLNFVYCFIKSIKIISLIGIIYLHVMNLITFTQYLDILNFEENIMPDYMNRKEF